MRTFFALFVLLLLISALPDPASAQHWITSGQGNGQPMANQYQIDQMKADALEADRRDMDRMRREMQDIRMNQEEMLRQQMESMNAAASLRRLEEQRLRQEIDMLKREEARKQAAETEANKQRVLETVRDLENQVSEGVALTTDQGEWVASSGRALRAYLESPETKMIIEMLREHDTGFTGVSGKPMLDPVKARTTKERLIAEKTLYRRILAIHQANQSIVHGDQAPPSAANPEVDYSQFQKYVPNYSPENVPKSIRPKTSATSAIQSRKQALMRQGR